MIITAPCVRESETPSYTAWTVPKLNEYRIKRSALNK